MKRFMKEISQKMCRSGWEGSGLCEFLKLFGEKEKKIPFYLSFHFGILDVL